MSEDETETGSFKEGPLLKMKKGLGGTKYWKKNWVYLDENNLFQWQTSTKPVKGEAPKYACNLKECKVEESQIRKYAFKITEKSNQESMTFAADDFNSYDSWLKILFGSAHDNQQHTMDSRHEDTSVVSDDFRQVTSDKIADFFYDHDISLDPKCPAISEKDLRKLLHSIDPSINTTSTVTLILHDLQIKSGDKGLNVTIISYEEFKQWWNVNSGFLTSDTAAYTTMDSEIGFPHVDDADCILFAGMSQLLSVNSEFLLKSHVPRHTTYQQFIPDIQPPLTSDQMDTEENVSFQEDWNERYQSAVEMASLTQSYHIMTTGDEDKHRELWSNYRLTAVGEDGENDRDNRNRASSLDASAVAEEEVVPSPRYSLDDAVKSCVTLAALKGSFYKAALSGAKTLIDEFSLPAHMKSAKKITTSTTSTTEIDVTGNTPSGDIAHDLYELDRLLFRIIAVPAAFDDREPTTARYKQLATDDETAYKRVTSEQRTSNICMQTLESLYTDYQTRENWQHSSKNTKFKHFQRPCALLCTLVDYGGFCVQVQCSTHIMEQFTLLHGFATDLPPLPAEPNREEDGLDMSLYPAEQEQPEPVFVNACPAYRSVLSQLAESLHLQPSHRLLNVMTSSLFESDEERMDRAHVDMLSTDLQAHKGIDDRLYMLNFSGILPPDLPREHSFDTISRQLRPEFVKKYPGSAIPSGDIYSCSSSNSSSSSDEGKDESKNDDDVFNGDINAKYNDSQLSVIKASRYLYTVVIPNVAKSLDMVNDLIPVDSHELAHYLHVRGVSCRHLGLLYSLCKTPCVRQLLLTECIARACKKILRQTMRHIARKSRAETLTAERRGRSKDSDYIEYMDLAHSRRRKAVLDLFNAVFVFPLSGGGSGSSSTASIGLNDKQIASEEFWRTALLQTITQKFGVDLEITLFGSSGSNRRIASLLHLPQLFLALQYHTNCRFKDTSYSHVFAGQGSVQFTLDDIVSDCIPCADGQELDALLQIPGELGRVAAAAESYLLRGLFNEATQAFQLRLAFLTALSGATFGDDRQQQSTQILAIRQENVLADTIYKLALSQYCGGHYVDAVIVCQDYLKRHSQYLVSSGRILTLLMSIEHRCGRMNKVRCFFDASQCVYSHTLSVHHPVISMLMCALADLYLAKSSSGGEIEGLKHAKAMLVVARSVSCKALGEHHLVSTAYACKLAVLLMRDGMFRDATSLLSSALTVFDSISSEASMGVSNGYQGLKSGGRVRDNRLDKETVSCLHALTVSFAHCEELDLAIHSGFRCVELCAEVMRGSPLSPLAKKCHTTHMSCLLILSDMFVQKSELDSAFGLLHEAWTSLRSTTIASSAQNGSGYALAALSCRIIELMVSTLPMQTRSLFLLVAEEALLSVDEADPTVWVRARDVVLNALWSQKPADYLAFIIQGIHQQETVDTKVSSRRKELTSVSLQAAVIAKLIKNPQEFSQQLVSF